MSKDALVIVNDPAERLAIASRLVAHHWDVTVARPVLLDTLLEDEAISFDAVFVDGDLPRAQSLVHGSRTLPFAAKVVLIEGDSEGAMTAPPGNVTRLRRPFAAEDVLATMSS